MRTFIVLSLTGIVVLAAGCSNEEMETLQNQVETLQNQAADLSDELRYLSDAIIIKEAKWEPNKDLLKVDVRVAEGGHKLAVSSALHTGRTLAVEQLPEGEHQFILKDVSDPPCRVRVKRDSDGVSVERDVEPQPEGCG